MPLRRAQPPTRGSGKALAVEPNRQAPAIKGRQLGVGFNWVGGGRGRGRMLHEYLPRLHSFRQNPLLYPTDSRLLRRGGRERAERRMRVAGLKANGGKFATPRTPHGYRDQTQASPASIVVGLDLVALSMEFLAASASVVGALRAADLDSPLARSFAGAVRFVDADAVFALRFYELMGFFGSVFGIVLERVLEERVRGFRALITAPYAKQGQEESEEGLHGAISCGLSGWAILGSRVSYLFYHLESGGMCVDAESFDSFRSFVCK
uniref:Uncharacterized protein n=1 Tax=Physcomitrium patens TaxID=3218 RepID=A0A2K1IVQ5_PHYPA|nr:hypothetical protein PHYPA_025302 [Physcomitrium patens]